MHVSTLLPWILTTLSVTLPSEAANHNHYRPVHRRRHAARANAASEVKKFPARDDSDSICSLGSWKCAGTELQRCYNGGWHLVQNCTGENIVCSADSTATGCVWTWSVESTSSSSAASPSASIASGTQLIVPSNITLYNVTTGSVVSNTTSPMGDDGDEECDDGEGEEDGNGDGEEECDDGEDEGNEGDEGDDGDCEDEVGEPATTSATAVVAIQTDNGTAPYTNNTTGDDSDDGDYDDCDDDDDMTATITSTSAAATASVTASITLSSLGGELYVGQHGGHRHSSHVSTTDWYGASATESITNSMTESITQPITAVSTSTAPNAAMTDSDSDTGYNATAPYTGGSSITASPISTSSHKHHKGTTTTTSAYASATNATSGGSGGTTTFSAPHYVVYADEWLNTMPAVADLAAYNRFILAFWMSDTGAVDDAQAWEGFDANTREQVLEEYHAAGIALMVSAFGSTDSPTTSGTDPTQVAQDLASWVIQYGLDGVDIDYEDMTAMNSNSAEAWLITFQRELRSLLPSPYIISHAPVAPWFTSANDYAEGAYVKIHQEVGDSIDFYNVQFYNQGQDVYCDCESLINNSGNAWPSTSVMEINSYAGVPLEKIVIGKPLDEGAADNGYMSPSQLAECVTMAQASGWNAGVMFWEWTGQAPSVMATVRG